MAIEKTFNPDYDYSFWFHKPKFLWIMEMLALLTDYDFAIGEIDSMLLSLENTNDTDASKWSGGLHYGNKGTMYINMALDAENRDMVHISITTKKEFQTRLEFIDLLQCSFEGFHKFRTY